MKLPWRDRGAEPLPEEVRSRVGPDRVLAWSREEGGGRLLVVGEQGVYAVGPGEAGWGRPWHLVDGGSFDREASTLRMTWVDGSPPEAWRLPLDSTVPELFRARVQATVVLADQVDLGPARRAKVVIRKDLRDQQLLTQVVLGRGGQTPDPEFGQAIDAALDRLKEQVGLV